MSDPTRVQIESNFFDNYATLHNDYSVYKKEEYFKILGLLNLKKTTNLNILSIGCGTGIFESILLDDGYNVFGIDLSINLLKKCNFKKAKADCIKLPFKDKSFDNILCAAILHHVPVTLHESAIKEFSRTLKSNGKLLIFEPKTTFRSQFLHPLSQLLKMRTATEAPINSVNFKNLISKNLIINKFEFLPRIKCNFDNKFISFIYSFIQNIFSLIPFIDNNEFFIIIADKKP